jgi:hypothetical protein
MLSATLFAQLRGDVKLLKDFTTPIKEDRDAASRLKERRDINERNK